MSNRAWVTLATNDSYGLGALVLAHSLRRAGSAYPAVVLITPSVTDAMRDRLSAVFAEVVTVDVLDSRDAAHLALLQRPELGITFTKIHCWSLIQYEKCVFLDADTLVIQNCDELFEREELSAAPDVGWPDCFNSGVFVFTPSAETFDRLIQFAEERGSFDGGDQGLLNSFFSDWAHGDINKHLPFIYNVTSAAFYSYLPALKHFGANLKIIHFIGLAKPWLQQFNWESRTVDAPEHLRGLLQLWWDLFVSQVHSQLDTSMVEVEAPHDESTDNPPEFPPQDVGQHSHYQPVLDPESEFPWHRPDAQTQDECREECIDMSEFHDPWDIYRGHIPPISDDARSHRSEGNVDDHDELRKYAWEYQAQLHHIPDYRQSQVENVNQTQSPPYEYSHRDSYQNTASMDREDSREAPFIEHHWQHEIHRDYNHDQQSIQSYHEQPSEPQGFYNYPVPEHWHQELSCPECPQQDHSQHHVEHIQHHSCPSPHYAQNDDHNYQQHSNHNQHNNEQIHDNTQQNQVHTRDQFDHSPSKYAYHPHDVSSHHQQHVSEHSVVEHPKNHNEHNHEYFDYQQNNSEPYVASTSKQQQVEVRHVHVEKDNDHHSPSRKLNGTDTEKSGMLNGDLSDSDSEIEDIRPRHPYDGFYLRHRATIDSRGRKICTHEIPPTPLPSPPESPEPHEYFSAEEGSTSDYEDQSGVAGNFARVVLGSGGQREAIDDLTRRQGWEAGNIDYMGVDSFDNIWAKISQTLSQPRSSPPKSPPKELAQPQPAPEQVEVQTGEVVQEPVTEPVEEAKEAVPVEVSVPKEAVPVEASVPKEAVPVEASVPKEVVPVEASAPVAVTAPVDAPPPPIPAPAEVVVPAEASVLAKTPVNTEGPAHVEALAQSKTVVPTEAPAPSATTETPVAAEVPVSVEPSAVTKTPTEIPIAVPVSEIPVPVEAAVPIHAPKTVSEPVIAPEVRTKKPKEKTEKPAVVAAPVTRTAPVKPAVESPIAKPTKVAPASPAAVAEAPVAPEATPEKLPVAPETASDSPPLANTPSKEEVPSVPAAQSAERRKPGKLQLSPPAAADPLPTPDSELEDAASLAHSIIASELRTPTVTAPEPAPSPASPLAQVQSRLSVAEPEVPTPPVDAVSLAQIGVKQTKGKSTTAAQIESSLTEKVEPAPPTEAPKKKVVKKVVKKEGATGADAPVPPPRKKEKKPKEK